MRARWLLPFLQEQARHQAFPRDPAPHHPIVPARRGLALVLCGRDDVVAHARARRGRSTENLELVTGCGPGGVGAGRRLTACPGGPAGCSISACIGLGEWSARSIVEPRRLFKAAAVALRGTPSVGAAQGVLVQ